MNNTLTAFLMTLVAGIATGIGSLIAFFCKSTNKTFLAVSLGFSAGVMIYVSTVELFRTASDSLTVVYGETGGGWITLAAFFSGMVLLAVIDRFIPSPEKSLEKKSGARRRGGADSSEQASEQDSAPQADNLIGHGKNVKRDAKMMRTGMMTALSIAIHNFPEGMATFVSALAETGVAVPIVIAIAIHNIPEGIAVSAPVYAATGSKRKAFVYSFLSGLAEPIGALFGWLVLLPIMSDAALGVIFAAVAGIMVYISVDELLPAARESRNGRIVTYGAAAGMAVMAISLMLFV